MDRILNNSPRSAPFRAEGVSVTGQTTDSPAPEGVRGPNSLPATESPASIHSGRRSRIPAFAKSPITMTNGVISLDDITSSSNDGQSTESQSDDSDDELAEVCEMVGADLDHAREYVDEHGAKDDIIDLARTLANDDELWGLMEEYRRMNDINRIILNFLRPHEKEFTAFTGQFYGDSSDPEPGTYNDVQDRAQDSEGNLMWYKALFPEPVTEYWEGDAVLYHEFDEIGYPSDDKQDSHIYVTEDFVEEYAEFGEDRPRPPANDEVGSSGSGSVGNSPDAELDPSDHTVPELRDALQDLLESGADSETFVDILEAEVEGKDRKTAKKAIRGAKNEAKSRNDSESDSESEQVDFNEVLEGVEASPEEVVEALRNL